MEKIISVEKIVVSGGWEWERLKKGDLGRRLTQDKTFQEEGETADDEASHVVGLHRKEISRWRK